MNYKHFLFLLIIFSVSFIACKTTPKVVDSTINMEENNKEDKKGIEEALDKIVKEAEKARKEAIENRADKSHFSLFEKADEKLHLAKEVATKNKEDGIKKFNEAKNMYQTLSNLAKCLEYKKDIDENKFQEYDQKKYDEAGGFYAKAIEKYNTGDFSSLSISEQALSHYESLYNQGYFELAKEAKKLAREAKERCDTIKVARSMTKAYNEAILFYNTGNVHMVDKNYKDAYKSYTTSGNVFDETYKTVEAKRKEAVAALERAKEKLKQSSSLANEADKISPPKEGIDGFAGVDSSSLENKDSKKEDVHEIRENEEN